MYAENKHGATFSFSFCLEAALTSLSADGPGAACDIFYWDWRAWRWLCGPVGRGAACWSPAARTATETYCPLTTSVGWRTRSGNSSAAAACRKPWIRLWGRGKSRRHAGKKQWLYVKRLFNEAHGSKPIIAVCTFFCILFELINWIIYRRRYSLSVSHYQHPHWVQSRERRQGNSLQWFDHSDVFTGRVESLIKCIKCVVNMLWIVYFVQSCGASLLFLTCGALRIKMAPVFFGADVDEGCPSSGLSRWTLKYSEKKTCLDLFTFSVSLVSVRQRTT